MKIGLVILIYTSFSQEEKVILNIVIYSNILLKTEKSPSMLVKKTVTSIIFSQLDPESSKIVLTFLKTLQMV